MQSVIILPTFKPTKLFFSTGVPTLFLTLSAADLHWHDSLSPMFYLRHHRMPTEDELNNLTAQERCSLLNSYPHIAAMQFYRRITVMFQIFRKSPHSPFGKVCMCMSNSVSNKFQYFNYYRSLILHCDLNGRQEVCTINITNKHVS